MRKVVDKREVSSGKWLRTLVVSYRDTDEQVMTWEAVERVTKLSENPYDGVEVLALLETRPVPQIVLVSQFRPPMDAYCLEMPAGLISEPQENPGDAALRELEEETGYHGRVIEELALPLVVDPGMSNSCVKLVRVSIDPHDPQNIAPQPNMQNDESIETHLLPFDKSLLAAMEDLCRSRKFTLDSRLACIAMGMQLAEPNSASD